MSDPRSKATPSRPPGCSVKVEDRDLHWLVVIFLGRVAEVPPFDLSRLRAFGFIDEKEDRLSITSCGQDALAEFQRRVG